MAKPSASSPAALQRPATPPVGSAAPSQAESDDWSTNDFVHHNVRSATPDAGGGRAYVHGYHRKDSTAFLTGFNRTGGIYAGTYGSSTAANGTPLDVTRFDSPLLTTGVYVNFGTVNALSTGPGYLSSGALVINPGLNALGSAGTGTTLSVGGPKPAVASAVAGVWQLDGAIVTTSDPGAATPVGLDNVIAAVTDGSTRSLSLVNEASTATVTNGSAAAQRVAAVDFRLGTYTANTYFTVDRTLSMNGVLISEATPGSSLNKYGAGTMNIGSGASINATNTFTGGLTVTGGATFGSAFVNAFGVNPAALVPD